MLSGNVSSNYLAPLGISLVLLNTSVGIWANFFVDGQSGMSNVLVFIGVLLTVDWKNLFHKHLSMWNRYFSIMLFFQLLAITYFGLSSYTDIRHLYFHLAIVAFLFSLSTREDVNGKNLVRFLFCISFVTTLCGLNAFSKGMLNSLYWEGQDTANISQEQEDVLELFTVGSSGFYCFCSALLLLKENPKYLKILATIAILLAFLLIALCTKRNPFIKCILAFGVLLHNQYSLRVLFKGKNIIQIVIVVVLCLIMIKMTEFGKEALSALFDNTVAGFSDMWTGKATDLTGSASARAAQRQMGLNLISNMSLDELFIGVGYMWKWLDVPLVQIICDMGLLGFCFFFYLTIYKPLKAMWMCKKSTLVVLVGLLLSVHLSQCMSSGHPYNFAYYLGPAFLFWALKYEKRSRYYKKQ